MSNDEKSSGKKGMDPTIATAIIGGVVTIVVAIIGVMANRPPAQPTALPTVVVITATPAPTNTVAPTDTSAPGMPTSTPAPITDTPAPTETAVPVALGTDWAQSCISTLWRPYPSDIPVLDSGNGCWKNPVQVFSASNGNLAFIAQRSSNGPTENIGLFAPLPSTGSISVKVQLRDLTNVDMLLGVYANPDLTSQGILMTIPSGNVKKRLIVQKDNVASYTTLQTTGTLDQGDGFWFTFNFTPNSVNCSVNPSVFVTNPVSIPSDQKWFFIGYRGLSGTYQADGDFTNLELK